MKNVKQVVRRVLGTGLPVPAILKPVIRCCYWLAVGIVEGMVFLKKVFWTGPVLRSLCDASGKGLRVERLPYIRGRGRLVLGDRVHLSGRSCFYFSESLPEPAEIVIGDNVFIGNRCTLSAAKRIRVGNNVLISSQVRIHDKDDHPVDPKKRADREPVSPENVREVVIRDNAWIGASAIILKGVTIGKNAVVGAGAVVTRDVEPDTVVAGNPAVIVKTLR